jgi:hypothetical protein
VVASSPEQALGGLSSASSMQPSRLLFLDVGNLFLRKLTRPKQSGHLLFPPEKLGTEWLAP